MKKTIPNLIDVARRRGIELSVRDDGELVVIAPSRRWRLADLLHRHAEDVVVELLEEGLTADRRNPK